VRSAQAVTGQLPAAFVSENMLHYAFGG